MKAIRLGCNRRHLGLQQDLLVALVDPLHQGRHDVLVRAGDDLIHQLNHRDLDAERVIDRRHFKADDASAEHQQPLRQAIQFKRAG